MKILRTTSELSEYRASISGSLCLIPTMGYLHRAHLELCRQGQQVAERSLVTIFVNPAQFNQADDFEKYPRSEEQDFAKLESIGVNAVYCPSVHEIYPLGFQSWVEVENVTQRWEGEGRPGHFRGVATILTILFHMIRPTHAIFGEKDFQQLRLVEKLVQDLRFPLAILRGALVRDNDGLALSSRNVRLSASDREQALAISRSLFAVKDAFDRGERSWSVLRAIADEILLKSPNLTPEYYACVDEESLEPCGETVPEVGARVLTTASISGVRLLDNIAL